MLRSSTTETNGVQAARITRLEFVLAWTANETNCPRPLDVMKFDFEKSRISRVPL